MVHITSRTHDSRAHLLVAAVALLLLTACDTPKREADYRQNAKPTVGRETVTMVVAVPADGAQLAGIEAAKFEQFVRRYVESGQGQMTVEASGAAVERAQAMLVKEGVRGREIVVTQGAAADSAVLSYVAATVKVPECGDWSSNATHNWSNRVHSNFGCATQHNIGLMVRNPADLERSREESGGDGEHGAGVVNNYRKAPTVLGVQKQKSAATGSK